MKLRLTFLLFSCLFAGPSLRSQTTVVDSFQHGGLMRNYLLYIPAIYDGSHPVPLVFNLHGYTSDNIAQAFYANFQSIADTANFIIALPNGTLDSAGLRFWNCFSTSTVDDLGFLSSLIDTVSAHYSIDPNRIYNTGMSNGGFMSYELACFLSNRIAAVASVTGSMASLHMLNCAAAHPTPVMQIHGTADATVPYTGTLGVAGIETLVAHWVNFNQCNPVPVMTPVPDINLFDFCTAEHYVYSGGTNGVTCEFYKILGGGHSWPGAPVTIAVTNQDFSACEQIWRFFSQYRLDQLVSNQKPVEENLVLSISPNPSSGRFMVKFETAESRTINVYNLTGQCVFVLNSSQRECDFAIQTPGMYWLEVREGTKRKMLKLVVN